MQNLLAYMYPLGCVIILIILDYFLATISSQLSEPSIVQLTPLESKKESVAEKMNRKRKILERGCSMIATLYEMSQNGTSYENLLTWHARIHDLNYKLSPSNEKCYPPLRLPKTIFYQVPGEKSTSLFCLPPKCGTTSYQRALSQHIISLIWNSKNESLQTYADQINNILNKSPEMVFLGRSGKIGKITSDLLRAPFVYNIMDRFKNISFQNPMTFVNRNQTTVPIYPEIEHLKKRVINTRNPFSRLNAAWRDKKGFTLDG